MQDTLHDGILRIQQIAELRKQATELYNLGKINEAISIGLQGRYYSNEDIQDLWSINLIDWLIENNNHDHAAQIAIECIIFERGSANEAAEIALKHAGLGKTIGWNLAIMAATLFPGTDWIQDEVSSEKSISNLLNLISENSPFYSTLQTILALLAIQEKNDYAEALQILEKIATKPENCNILVVENIWKCRIQILGLDAALNSPFISSTAGGWNYNLGLYFELQIFDHLGIIANNQQVQQARTIATRYYEAGYMCFDNFFKTGKGAFRDSDLHGFSMLCNNLALIYRDDFQKYAEAVNLHEQGLQTSPFAEHYEGIIWCYHFCGAHPNNWNNIILAAEDLWHFAIDHGYSRHLPHSYIALVREALSSLDRKTDIAIWIERLISWWTEFGQDCELIEQRRLLGELASCLTRYSESSPEDALNRTIPLIPLMRNHGPLGTIRLIGMIYQNNNKMTEASSYYQEVINTEPKSEIETEQIELAKINLDSCNKTTKKANSWWKL